MSFIEQVGHGGAAAERESKLDRKQILKKTESTKKPVVLQGLDEDDDNAYGNNNEDEDPDVAARDNQDN